MSVNGRVDILVPRLVDLSNQNAQNLNARALLSRFKSPEVIWHTFCYDEPDPAVANRSNVRCHRLLHGRFWTWHAILKYQGRFDGLFYPGNEWFDSLALKLRVRMRREIPVVGTLEALPGHEAREISLSTVAGHTVKCLRPRSGPRFTRSHDEVRRLADLNIAISPFLKQMGQHLYGGDFSNLSLGVELTVFNSKQRNGYPRQPTVIGAGTLYEAKRPQIFVELASRFPNVDFVWYGDGPLRNGLVEQSAREGLAGLHFPGPVSPSELASRFRQASLFVLPSYSEGVPKVTQEAAACGLPVICFGYYEAPTVVDGRNGYVVWNDEELVARVAELAADPGKCELMGAAGIEMSKDWEWDKWAFLWESAVLERVRGGVRPSEPQHSERLANRLEQKFGTPEV